MKLGATLNDTRLASAVLFATFALSYPALAGDGARCTKASCQAMNVPLGCKLYGTRGNGRMRCSAHQLNIEKPRPRFGGDSGPQILLPATTYTIDRGSTICN
jgi:hypothetical protein